ncbi:gas vesicle protein [Nocardioides sp. LHG3406-4]|uniref:gas vesicle protein n=1 Tax=Nocardioides sp. LHG3406-4 TaxID=2804575 RepID=UPI003CED5C6F
MSETTTDDANLTASRPFVAPLGQASARPQPANLADILERVLDKGIIIAGDIKVNLLDIELLTIKIRLLIVSVDKAQEMGIDWWRNDPMLSTSENALAEENRALRERVEALEQASGDAAGSGRGDRQGGSRE